MHHSLGFGIQSPTDYAFVRYVVNEHWPYYAYDELHEENWLREKLGRLYFRLANWRQPAEMPADDYQQWWRAGCRRLKFVEELTTVELARLLIEDHDGFERLAALCNQQSVLVVEGLWRDKQQWKAIEADPRVGTTFDLYYCGIVLFDTQRYKHHYKINF